MTTARRTAQTVKANDREIYVEQVGQGPDVLLIAAWETPSKHGNSSSTEIADRYRLTAFDNRGAGRTALGPAGCRWRRWPTTPPGSCAPSSS